MHFQIIESDYIFPWSLAKHSTSNKAFPFEKDLIQFTTESSKEGIAPHKAFSLKLLVVGLDL